MNAAMDQDERLASKAWRRGKAALVALGQLGTVAVIGATASGYAGALWWRADLFSHFKLQYLWASALALLVFVLARKRWWILAAGLTVLANGWEVGRIYLPAPGRANADAAEQPALRVFVSNVHTSNRRFAAVMQAISTSRPDIAILLEIDQDWADALAPLGREMPYAAVHPQYDNFGIAVYSKVPVEPLGQLALGSFGVPSMAGTVHWQGRTISLIATHPVPPMSTEYAAGHNEQLRDLAAHVAATDGPVLVCGDLNTTMWSPIYRQLEETSRLENARQGAGVLPTWPGFARTGALQIPIDHCLHSEHLAVRDIRVGPDIGSDHLPLIVDIVYREQGSR